LVEPGQIVVGILLVAALVVMGSYFAWRQLQLLGTLRRAADLSAEDRSYTVRQAWRRLTGSVLMLVLAMFLAVHFFLEGPASEIVAQGEAARKQQIRPQLDPSQLQFLNFYRNFWIIVLLLLLAIILLAGWDYLAIRRFGLRHYRRIQQDRRAMIENELSRLRSQRNGHN
jgi:H+/gluconate symporter-like permease